jgi:hypothetical protein
MSAHDADNAAPVNLRCRIVERISNGVIMKGGTQVGGEGSASAGM